MKVTFRYYNLEFDSIINSLSAIEKESLLSNCNSHLVEEVEYPTALVDTYVNFFRTGHYGKYLDLALVNSLLIDNKASAILVDQDNNIVEEKDYDDIKDKIYTLRLIDKNALITTYEILFSK